MLFILIAALIFCPNQLLNSFVKADGRNDAIIPYLDDDTLGLNVNDLDEDDEELLPPCDLTKPDPKLVQWRLPSNSHEVFLDFENVSNMYCIL